MEWNGMTMEQGKEPAMILNRIPPKPAGTTHALNDVCKYIVVTFFVYMHLIHYVCETLCCNGFYKQEQGD